jgi:hypothetical protein
MAKFFFPLMFIQPNGDWERVEEADYAVSRRLWRTSSFDLATLATRHSLHLPYQIMDVMLARCNLEVQVEAEGWQEATERLHEFLLGLYVLGTSPTLSPFCTTYSVNEYSGINTRDSEFRRDELPEGLAAGLRSDEATLEGWPVDLSFSCQVVPDSLGLTENLIRQAAHTAAAWRALEAESKTLRVVRTSAQAAALLSSRAQSLLHVWCALEALFPSVSSEVSFRIALYLAQLNGQDQRQQYFKRVRKAYNIRSKVAHGIKRDVSAEEWHDAWSLLVDSMKAVLQRGGLPGDKVLLAEILAGGGAVA